MSPSCRHWTLAAPTGSPQNQNEKPTVPIDLGLRYNQSPKRNPRSGAARALHAIASNIVRPFTFRGPPFPQLRSKGITRARALENSRSRKGSKAATARHGSRQATPFPPFRPLVPGRERAPPRDPAFACPHALPSTPGPTQLSSSPRLSHRFSRCHNPVPSGTPKQSNQLRLPELSQPAGHHQAPTPPVPAATMSMSLRLALPSSAPVLPPRVPLPAGNAARRPSPSPVLATAAAALRTGALRWVPLSSPGFRACTDARVIGLVLMVMRDCMYAGDALRCR